MSARRVAAILLGGVALLAGMRVVAAQGTTPPVTLLYQNFPNPFPTASSATTCIWFDLQSEATVTLAIYDLRGRLVRTMVPASGIAGRLPAGYYGRNGAPSAGGCDPRFAWDGRGSDGSTVPPGVYLARLNADGSWQTRKIVFRGP